MKHELKELFLCMDGKCCLCLFYEIYDILVFRKASLFGFWRSNPFSRMSDFHAFLTSTVICRWACVFIIIISFFYLENHLIIFSFVNEITVFRVEAPNGRQKNDGHARN